MMKLINAIGFMTMSLVHGSVLRETALGSSTKATVHGHVKKSNLVKVELTKNVNMNAKTSKKSTKESRSLKNFFLLINLKVDKEVKKKISLTKLRKLERTSTKCTTG